MAESRGPVFGYTGVIDERIDFAIVQALREAFPDGPVVLVGPVVKIDPASLPRRPNIHFTGIQPYAALPSYLAGFDVGEAAARALGRDAIAARMWSDLSALRS